MKVSVSDDGLFVNEDLPPFIVEASLRLEIEVDPMLPPVANLTLFLRASFFFALSSTAATLLAPG